MIVLVPNIALIALGIAAIVLINGRVKDGGGYHVKWTIVLVSVCLMIVATINILFYGSPSNFLVLAEINVRAVITICWFLLIYIAIYGEIKEKARRRERELEALNDVALAVGKSMDIKQTLINALSSVVKIANFGVGFVYLLNEDKHVLELVASHGDIPDNIARRLSVLDIGQEL